MKKPFRYFAAVGSLDEKKRDKWIEVLKVGTFDQRDGSGPFTVSQADLHQAVETGDSKFFQFGQKMPIFVGHQVMTDPTARISEERHGGIDALRVDGDRLMGHANFVEEMAQKIRDEKFTGVSSEFAPDIYSEAGDSLGFGLMAVCMTNVSFLGLDPISLSTPAAQENTMTLTASEQKLMVLTGATTPETACAHVETTMSENVTLKAENEALRKESNILKDGLENQKALALINKAIGENKPVSGMVEGYDATPTTDNPNPALKAITVLGGVAGAVHVFGTLTPMASKTKGVDIKPTDDQNDEGSDPKDDEIDGIPQSDLTLVQARKHYCDRNDIPMAAYMSQGKFFAGTQEAKALLRDGYHLVEQDRPKEKE